MCSRIAPGFKGLYIGRAEVQKSATAHGKQADSAEVAKDGYKAMLKGQLYTILGLMNILLTYSSKLVPSRHLVLGVTNKVKKKKANLGIYKA